MSIFTGPVQTQRDGSVVLIFLSYYHKRTGLTPCLFKKSKEIPYKRNLFALKLIVFDIIVIMCTSQFYRVVVTYDLIIS